MLEKDLIELEKFYIENKSKLFNYAVSLVSNKATAEDVVHSVFKKMLEKDIKPQNLKAYIYRSIKNEIIDIWRKPQLFYEEELVFELKDEKDTKDNDLAEYVQYSLNKLDAKDKDIIILKIYNDMTFKEIAEVLDESINTISSRYRRGLEKLKKYIDGENNER
jgi:RNA polymerase sigma-70 factor, ECF subfamily